MAKRVVIELVDDLDGEPATQTIQFGIDAALYELDLSDANAAKLREVIGGYVQHAREVHGLRPGGGGRGKKAPSNEEIRAWARANGHEVSGRGRISQAIRDAYARR